MSTGVSPQHRQGFVRWWTGRSPAAGSAVMATGILSVGLHLMGWENLSRAALALGSLMWCALAADFAGRLLRDRERWSREADRPPALTAVAASGVLGTRFAQLGWEGLGVGLLVLALVVWLVLLPHVLRDSVLRVPFHEMPGAVFLVCVSTQALAVLAGTLAPLLEEGWLAHAAHVAFWLGLVLYGFALTRFDLRNIRRGAGDQWVACGALAISALAAAKLIATSEFTGTSVDILRIAALTLLGLAFAAYVLLAASEAVWPRFRFDVRRWATVFPMGMTGVATLSVATSVAGAAGLKVPGNVLVWVAVAVWCVVLTGSVRAAVKPS
ncbi:tellurite resistance/C4-dicarboxylate transporter family protein [Streptomyces sp. NPDC050418]|uniref:tellurite resistance/C4-dicarboxylate transporter family protein n=1 Tax=Streptomyces sp. NPDC050418 TaxID=3365612 RepID=UPI003799BE44